MTQPAKKSLVTLHVTKHEDGLQHFAQRGLGPAWMLGAHFIDKLPAILKSCSVIAAAAVFAYLKFGP